MTRRGRRGLGDQVMSYGTFCDRGWRGVHDLGQLHNRVFSRGRRSPIAADVVFECAKPIGDAIECSMHGREHVVGARHVLLQQVDARRRICPRFVGLLVCPDFPDVDQQIGQPALDSIKVVEPGIRRLQTLDKFGDAAFEMIKCSPVSTRLKLFDLGGQGLEQRFYMPYCGIAAVCAFRHGAAESVDAHFESVEGVASAATHCEVINLVAQRLDPGG